MGANFLDNYLYSGQEVADRGNVIVVTLGYRVGAGSLPVNVTMFDLCQEITVCGISRLPSPGCTEIFDHLVETPTTSPSLESLQVEPV